MRKNNPNTTLQQSKLTRTLQRKMVFQGPAFHGPGFRRVYLEDEFQRGELGPHTCSLGTVVAQQAREKLDGRLGVELKVHFHKGSDGFKGILDSDALNIE